MSECLTQAALMSDDSIKSDDDYHEASLSSSCMPVLIVCLQMQMECLDGRGLRSGCPRVAEGPWLAGVQLHFAPQFVA